MSQTGVTGSGTAADPFKVVTVVDVAATGLRIQQTDTYVTGQEFYTTEVMISNNGGATASGVLYRAGDASWPGPIQASVSRNSSAATARRWLAL